jgi:mRNA interferase MazF
VLLSRNGAYDVRDLVIVAPVTSRIRNIATEVALGREDGLPRACVVNLDTITTIPKHVLTRRLSALSAERITAVERALRFALGPR